MIHSYKLFIQFAARTLVYLKDFIIIHLTALFLYMVFVWVEFSG